MPCLLKRPAPGSPGIVTFTHNELLYGVIARSARVRDAIHAADASGRWLFGIHVQGDCSHLAEWPLEHWQAFVMWPDHSAHFLTGVPRERLVDLTAFNFLPETGEIAPRSARRWDLCIVSRASTIKRIEETLHLVRHVMDRRPGLRVNFIVPDPRAFGAGWRTYSADGVRAYFETPKTLFTATELRQLSFLSPSVEAFGQFPIAHDVVSAIIGRSKFLLMWSHAEGGPRAVGEALLAGTPCIVSARLRSGLMPALLSQPTVTLDDQDPAQDADRIVDALNRYAEFQVDVEAAEENFSEQRNRPRLISCLADIIRRAGHDVIGDWYLEDLPQRLSGHGRKSDLQFMNNPDLFFRWFERVESVDPYDEDHICGGMVARDQRQFEQTLRLLERVNHRLRSIVQGPAAMTRRRFESLVGK